MSTAKLLRTACLALGVVLLGASCTGPRDASRTGVRGGTLRVLSADNIDGLDTAVTYTPNGIAIARTYARTLYGYSLSGPPERATVPVPDIASSPPQRSADQRTYTFTLRPGVRYAPPVNREVTAQDFITAIQRLYDRQSPSPGQQYADLIAGARAFGAGKARRIPGLAAPDPHTLTITLDQPAGDFLSILTMPFFAPVPGEYAAGYQVGANYDGHVVGSGPYTPTTYIPGRSVMLDRNPTGTRPPTPYAAPGSTASRSSSASLSRRSSGRSSGRRPTCRSTATCPRPSWPRSRPTPSDPGGCRSTPPGACCS